MKLKALIVMAAVAITANAQTRYELVTWSGNVLVDGAKPQAGKGRMQLSGATRMKLDIKSEAVLQDNRQMYTLEGPDNDNVKNLIDKTQKSSLAASIDVIRLMWNEVASKLSASQAKEFTGSVGAVERGHELVFTDSIYSALYPFLSGEKECVNSGIRHEWVGTPGSGMQHLMVQNMTEDILAVNVVCTYKGGEPILWFKKKRNKEKDLPSTIVLTPGMKFEITNLIRQKEDDCRIVVFGTHRNYDSYILQETIINGLRPQTDKFGVIF